MGVSPTAKTVRLPTDCALGLRGAISRLAERQGLLLLVLASYAAGLLLTARGTAPDTWLAVAAGHEVTGGLPSADHLTILGSGARWIDQQWLAQLLFYRSYTTGGLMLVALMSVALAFAAVAGAAAFAIRRGGGMRATAWVSVAALIPYLLSTGVPRTQTLVYPLFVLVVWLLIEDGLHPSPRVMIVLPLVALWANLHGSVLLAFSLVALHGLWTARLRPLVGVSLVGGSLLSVFASPYASSLPSYYRSTLFNPAFTLVSEWQPTTFKPATLPFFALLIATIYLYGRVGRVFTATETITLLTTALAALYAVRFIVWFALAAVMILPRPIAALLRSQPPPLRLNRLCGRLGIGAVVVLLGLVLLRGVTGYPPAAAAAVKSAAGGGADIYASELYSDWLFTVAPQLRGRVAYDARFELLSANAVGRIELARSFGIGWRDLSHRYRVFVLNPSDDRRLIANLSRSGYEATYRRGGIVVLVRTSDARSAGAEAADTGPASDH